MRKVAQNTPRRCIAGLLAICALVTALFALPACSLGADASKFSGTWDLSYGDTSSNDGAYTRENIASMRALGLEAYLNLDEDGSLALVSFDGVKYGSWKVESATEAEATVEGVNALVTLDGEELHLIQGHTTLVFSKGAPKDSSRAASKPTDASEDESSEASSADLSELVVKGSLLDEPVVIADDEIVTIEVNGVGTDRLGDPGYNMVLTNNSSSRIDVWVAEAFSVGGVSVRAYMFETIEPQRSETAFLQFDTADIKSSSPSALVNVSGVVLVDDDNNITIARYPFKM